MLKTAILIKTILRNFPRLRFFVDFLKSLFLQCYTIRVCWCLKPIFLKHSCFFSGPAYYYTYSDLYFLFPYTTNLINDFALLIFFSGQFGMRVKRCFSFSDTNNTVQLVDDNGYVVWSFSSD